MPTYAHRVKSFSYLAEDEKLIANVEKRAKAKGSTFSSAVLEGLRLWVREKSAKREETSS